MTKEGAARVRGVLYYSLSHSRSLAFSLSLFPGGAPAQGIEAEYHAKKDKVYCWRATRLVMATQSPWLDLSAKDGESSLLDKVAAALQDQAKGKSKDGKAGDGAGAGGADAMVD